VLDCMLTESEWRFFIHYGAELMFKGELIEKPVFDFVI